MVPPAKVQYRISNLHLNLFRTTYLTSVDGALFFKTSSIQELRVYRLLSLSRSALLAFIPNVIGIYRCDGDTLNLLVDLSGDFNSVELETIEELIATTVKCRTLNCQGVIFTALRNLASDADTGAEVCFMDLKLGFLTFPLDAQQSKIQSQEKKARDTTTATHGVRLMGAILPAKDTDPATASVLLTKIEGRACSYDAILSNLCSLFPTKHSLDQLIARLELLSNSLRKERLHLCGPSLLIYSTPPDHTRHATSRVFLVDFAHTYTRDQAVALCTNDHILSATASTTIATCIENLSHNLQSYHRHHYSSSSSS